MNANGGSAQRSIAPSLVGEDAPRRVGRFDLVTRLGAGGMANVFLARHQGAAGFERLAATYLLHRHLSSDEQFVQMFFDEARVAARIHHPNVVPILEIGSEEEQLYMVMDYVEGDTLADPTQSFEYHPEASPSYTFARARETHGASTTCASHGASLVNSSVHGPTTSNPLSPSGAAYRLVGWPHELPSLLKMSHWAPSVSTKKVGSITP